MSDLLAPGAHRLAGVAGVADDAAVLAALLRVEAAWSAALAAEGVAPAGAAVDADALRSLVGAEDVALLVERAEAGGNVVIPLLALVRERLPEPAAAWLHRGLTSQDVLDTALVLCAADALGRIAAAVERQVAALAGLVTEHRAAPAVARTLGQPAVPTVLGLRFAGWLAGVLDVRDELAGLRLPVQVGGAAGTRSGVVELAAARPDPESVAEAVVSRTAASLGLADAPAWHVTRRPLTRLGDALVAATDAWGHVANDVLLHARPELGELAEGRAGGSSTMPHKQNPVLAALLRRAALTQPGLAATLHRAAADAVEERTAGGWHAEAPTLARLLRGTVVAAEQAADLLAGLRVDADRAAANLAAANGVHAEQRSLAALRGGEPRPGYDGTAQRTIDAVLARAAAGAATGAALRATAVPPPTEPGARP